MMTTSASSLLFPLHSSSSSFSSKSPRSNHRNHHQNQRRHAMMKSSSSFTTTIQTTGQRRTRHRLGNKAILAQNEEQTTTIIQTIQSNNNRRPTTTVLSKEELLCKPNESVSQLAAAQAAKKNVVSTPANSSSVIKNALINANALSAQAFYLPYVALAAVTIKKILDTPSRAYVDGANTVGSEYDAWTEEGILEYYWGEHIHLGWYEDEDLANGAGTLLGNDVTDFKEAKFAFVDKMCDWSIQDLFGKQPANILDVGCGIGGASRHLAKRYGNGTTVTGITLSPNQRDRATELAKEQNVPNAEFKVMNALEMTFPDDTFDAVWACESGEHMPDKKKYVEEMIRVLKPGGVLVVATWCQRDADETKNPFTEDEKKNLQFLYEEWAHPYFVSYEEYERLMRNTHVMEKVQGENWVKNTIASWRHSIWVGVWDPWPVVFAGPRIWYKTIREIVTLERMHRAFDRGLMTYGLIKGRKKEEIVRDKDDAFYSW